jgi:hypothetical protein
MEEVSFSSGAAFMTYLWHAELLWLLPDSPTVVVGEAAETSFIHRPSITEVVHCSFDPGSSTPWFLLQTAAVPMTASYSICTVTPNSIPWTETITVVTGASVCPRVKYPSLTMMHPWVQLPLSLQHPQVQFPSYLQNLDIWKSTQDSGSIGMALYLACSLNFISLAFLWCRPCTLLLSLFWFLFLGASTFFFSSCAEHYIFHTTNALWNILTRSRQVSKTYVTYGLHRVDFNTI